MSDRGQTAVGALDFGRVSLSRTNRLRFAMTNRRSSGATLTAVRVVPPPEGWGGVCPFVVSRTPQMPCEVRPGGSVEVEIAFVPTGARSYEATAEVTLKPAAPRRIILRGVGVRSEEAGKDTASGQRRVGQQPPLLVRCAAALDDLRASVGEIRGQLATLTASQQQRVSPSTTSAGSDLPRESRRLAVVPSASLDSRVERLERVCAELASRLGMRVGDVFSECGNSTDCCSTSSSCGGPTRIPISRRSMPQEDRELLAELENGARPTAFSVVGNAQDKWIGDTTSKSNDGDGIVDSAEVVVPTTPELKPLSASTKTIVVPSRTRITTRQTPLVTRGSSRISPPEVAQCMS